MAVKVWNFLLPSGPAAGTHQVRVEKLASAGQTVTVDGEICETQQLGRRGEVKFEGLRGGLFELRKNGQKWSLCLDGIIVEDYEPHRRVNGDETLHELKGRPDGSYLIQTDIDASAYDLNIVIRFRFVASGIVHGVDLAHSDCVWQVVLDGKVVQREVHTSSDSQAEVSFRFRPRRGRPLDAVAQMIRSKADWEYKLAIDGVQVNPYWTKAKGEVKPAEEPVCVTASRDSSEFEAGLRREKAAETCLPERLPQGVSFDSLSGRYQANIRMKSGKFMWLGDFGSSEEAHKRYLEAVPAHYPEKAFPTPTTPSLPMVNAMPQMSVNLSAQSPAPSSPRRSGNSTLRLAGRAALGGVSGGLSGTNGSGSPVRHPGCSPPDRIGDQPKPRIHSMMPHGLR